MNHASLPSVSLAHARRTAARAAGCVIAFMFTALSLWASPVSAQSLPIYTDSLQNGFQDWSWSTRSLTNTSPVQAGSDSISVTFAAYQTLRLEHQAFDTAPYTALNFWVNGGATGGQQFNVAAQDVNGNPDPGVPVTNYLPGGSIPANTWVQVTIPLADLDIANTTDFGGFWLQDSTGGNQPTFYVDTISFLAPPAPPVVHVTVNAGQALQTVDSREFGVNTASWDANLATPATLSLMSASGAGVFRFPCGSASDVYDWTAILYGWPSTTPTFGTLTDATGGQAIMTTNYGTGSAQMAAAWVAYCNAAPSSAVAIGLDPAGRDWKTAGYWAALRGATPITPDDGLNLLRAAHAAPYGFKDWEIGNETYGSWETDSHTPAQDPVIYAGIAKSTTTLMKQVDPTIQVGLVVTATEDDQGNQTETVTNPVTGAQHKGWTAVLFSTLSGIDYVPDFVIFHNYAQWGGSESDATLLQYAPTWPVYAQGIRTMLTQYIGASRAANCQLLCTENNSVSTDPGKQTTSLVNGLYYADSFGALTQTEFKSLLWWDLRNFGGDTAENNSASLYGWRQYGDYGMLGSAGVLPGGEQDTPYPDYFALKLASRFARGGDTVVASASDDPLLSAYACKRANGDLCLLMINKSPATPLTASVALTGYTPLGTATTYTYGEAEDTLQSTGATVDLTQSSLSGITATFSATFSPYSMTVISLAPMPPAPTITSFTPMSGPIGTVVTITGANLTGVTAVRFHNASAKTFSANASGTQLTVTVPSGAAKGTITVTTPGGSVKTATNFTVN